MVTLKLYNFNKNLNSTKQPTGGTQITGLLIEPCSVLNPVIKINGLNGYDYNYCYISEFSRYYFIDDWETDNGFWFLHCSLDALASHKTIIGASTQYVERSASNQNANIVDTMFKTTGDFSSSEVTCNSGLNGYLPNGVFVINLTGSASQTIGSYACVWSTFKPFISELITSAVDDNWWGADMIQGIRNSLFKPFDHIGSVIWFPADYIDLTGITPVHSLTFGNLTITNANFNFYYLDLPSIWQSSSKTLPKHPQAGTYGKYMNLKPFSQYIYSDDIVGDVEMDPLKLYNTSTFRIWKLTDPATGNQITVLPDGQTRIGMAGVLIPMENNSLNLGGIISSVGAATAAFATGGGSAIAAGVGSTIAAATDLINPITTTTSQSGSVIGSWRPISVKGYFWNSVGHDASNKGNPYCRTAQISTLSGYILTSGAHISGTGLSGTELSMIENAMDSGFYYE